MKAIPPRPGFDWSRDERAELRRLGGCSQAGRRRRMRATEQGIILHIDRTY